MKYNLEIVLAVSMSGKYGRRLKDFKQFGLQQIGNNSVRLSILVGTEEIPEIDQGWPDGIETRIITCELDHCAAKMNDFYANYLIEDIDQTKWIMRVDDDSISKIDSLIKILNQLDHNDPIYLSTNPVEGETKIEKQLLKELDSRYKNDALWHEIECSILSHTCFKRILTSEFCRNLLSKRALIEEGFTDICLAACARECGIFPSWFCYINHYINIKQFLLGNVCHIHFVAHDVNKEAFDIINNDRSNCLLKDNNLIFCEKTAKNQLVKKNLILLKSNGVIETNLEKIAYWTFDNEGSEINIYNHECKVEFTFEFNSTPETEYFVAKFKKDRDNNFFIENKSSFFM